MTATKVAEIHADQRTGSFWRVDTDASGGLPLLPGKLCGALRARASTVSPAAIACSAASATRSVPSASSGVHATAAGSRRRAASRKPVTADVRGRPLLLVDRAAMGAARQPEPGSSARCSATSGASTSSS